MHCSVRDADTGQVVDGFEFKGPSWNADDGREHVFFDTVAYGHRLQSRLRKLNAAGGNRLEFSLADADGTRCGCGLVGNQAAARNWT
jgi:hypothetical protein